MNHLHFTMEPGGWLLLSLIYFLTDAEGLAVILANAAVHEFGHLLMLRHFRVYIRRVRFTVTGLCIDYQGLYLRRWQSVLVSLAGPAAGLSVAVLASLLGNLLGSQSLLLYAGAGLVLNGFNLLPARPLDGWGAVHALAPGIAEHLSAATAFAVLLLGLYLMHAGFGTALAFMGLALMGQGIGAKSHRNRCLIRG